MSSTCAERLRGGFGDALNDADRHGENGRLMKAGAKAVHRTHDIETAKRAAPVRLQTAHAAARPAFQPQSAVGNQALQQLLKSRAIHAKLAVGSPDDPLEKEADAVADRVMRAPAPRLKSQCGCGGPSGANGECEECRMKRMDETGEAPVVRRRAAAEGQSKAPPIVHEALGGAGRPLDSAIRADMEARFRADFGAVRIHTGEQASNSASAVQALAYTAGDHIVFARDQYSPHSDAGRRLLAHELTHVAQQKGTSGRHTIRRQGENPPPPPAQPAPGASAAVPGETPSVSPEDRQRQLYAATVMREVPRPDPAAMADLGKALSFAPVYEDIQERDKLRKDTEDTQKQLDDANTELSVAATGIHDVSGAPGGTDPGSGEPERASLRLANAKAEVARLSEKVAELATELSQKDALVKTELAALGVRDESELKTFVEVTFPNRFVERGKQIAIAQLEVNRKAATKEQQRYRTSNVGDRQGLLDACHDLDNRTNEIAEIAGTRYETLPAGGADPDDPGVQEQAEIQDKIAPKQQQLDKKRAEYQLKYPILSRLDPHKVATAPSDQLDGIVDGPIQVVLDNIDATEKRINDGDLKIWKLKTAGIDLPQLTKDDMKIEPGSTLDKIIDKTAAEDKSTGEMITEALNALSLVADTIALLTGPVGMAVAAGITAVAAVATLAQDYQTYRAAEAASNVAIDPEAAKMVAEQPDLEGLIYSLISVGVAALFGVGAIRAAVQSYRRSMAVARDLEEFEKLIQNAAIDDKSKGVLIDEARRQFAKAPTVSVEMLKAEFAGIRASFTAADKVGVARILHTFGDDMVATSLLEMQGTQINWLTPEGIEAAFAGDSALVNRLKDMYFGPAQKIKFSPGFTTKGKVFIRPDRYAEVASSVSHEVTHAIQQRAQSGLTAGIQYFQEHQAYLKQQEFLRSARQKLSKAEFETAFQRDLWLVDADDDAIAAHIKQNYGFTRPQHIPLDRDELLNNLKDELAPMVKRQLLRALALRLGKE